jgi:hypothetical protein
MLYRSSLWLLFLLLLSNIPAKTDKLGVKISKPSVLSFPEDIIDVELGNQDYIAKIKGKNFLIWAKTKNSLPTTLFVRYGDHKEVYVAEIYPDEPAPLQRLIQREGLIASAIDQENPVLKEAIPSSPIFLPDEKQAYYNYGFSKAGIKVILTNIAYQGEATYVRIFIENTTSTNLNLANFTFEYLSYVRKFLFFKTKKTKIVTPLVCPSALLLAPQEAGYFVFAIPSYSSNGGLEIFLGESGQGERAFKLAIPNKVLLKAPRR